MVPVVNGSGKRIVIEIVPTGVVGEYGIQTHKVGMENDDWGVVHSLMAQALHQVAQTWAQEIARRSATVMH